MRGHRILRRRRARVRRGLENKLKFHVVARTDAAIRSDFFLVANGNKDSLYPQSGYITVGLDMAGVLNGSFMVMTKGPDQAGSPSFQPTVPNPALDFSNWPNETFQFGANNQFWIAALPSYNHSSFFNPNNFGIKLVIGPFYRWSRGYMPGDTELLKDYASNMVNSGANIYGVTNGPAEQKLDYAGAQMTREDVMNRYSFNKIHPVYSKRIRVIRKYLSVLMPPNARFDFRVKIPGVKSTPRSIIASEWQTKYRYSQTCFYFRAFSGVVFDSGNAAVTAYGAGPGWGMTHVKPALCAHCQQVTPIKVKVMTAPWYFVNTNPRVAARASTAPKFNSVNIVEAAVDNAMF